MDTWQQGDVTVNGVRLRYHRSGGPGAPVVLVHGLTDHGLYWSPLARALAADYDVVLYDSRGHGASDPSPEGYTLELLAADLVALAGQLGLARPAVIGHSMGGSTASLAVSANPGLFRAAVLEDPVWRLGGPFDAQTLIDGWRAGLLADRQVPRADLIARERAANPGWLDEDYELWADSKAAVLPEALDVMPSFDRDWLAEARAIDCPLLVLTGEPERGAIVGDAEERAVLDANPRARVVRLAGTGHQVRRGRLADFTAEVRRLLAEVG